MCKCARWSQTADYHLLFLIHAEKEQTEQKICNTALKEHAYNKKDEAH